MGVVGEFVSVPFLVEAEEDANRSFLALEPSGGETEVFMGTGIPATQFKFVRSSGTGFAGGLVSSFSRCWEPEILEKESSMINFLFSSVSIDARVYFVAMDIAHAH